MANHNLQLCFALSLCMVLGPWIFIEAAPLASLVTQLPDFDATFPSKHYSGYAIHYSPPFFFLKKKMIMKFILFCDSILSLNDNALLFYSNIWSIIYVN